MSENEEIEYTEEPLHMGQRVDDFLPPPEELVFRPKGVKVTIILSEKALTGSSSRASACTHPTSA